MENVGIDNGAGTGWKGYLTQRSLMNQPAFFYIEYLHCLVPMPGIVVLLVFGKFQKCTDTGKAGMKVREQLFFRTTSECYTGDWDHDTTSSNLFTVKKMTAVPIPVITIPAIRTASTPNPSSCPPAKLPAEQPNA